MCSSIFAEVWHKVGKLFRIYRFVRVQDIVIHVIFFMGLTFVALNNEMAFGLVISKIVLGKRAYQWHTSFCPFFPHCLLLTPLRDFVDVSHAELL